MLWKLCRRRVIQIVVELLFVAGLLASAERLQLLITRWLNGPGWLFWTALVAVAMVPLFAVWRNVSVLALMVAEFSTEGMAVDARDRLRSLIALGVRIVATVAMVTWVASFAPTGAVRWALPASALVALAVFVWLRQRMIFWHSELEVGLQDVLGDAGVVRMSSTSVPWAGRQHEEWNLSVADCVIPDLAECSGRSLAQLGLRARFGCTVVGVERQGCMISLPGSGESLFPRDKVLLLGDPEHMVAAKAALGVVAATESSEFDAVGLETILVPARSRAAGATLAELSPSAVHGVQLAGIGRGPLRILNPGPGERLQPGDKVLALGTPVKLRAFRAWVRDNQAQRISAGGGDGGSRTDGEVDALA